MNAILDWGVSLILFFQSLGNWLEGPMEFFSFLGREEFYMLISPAIYWCLDAAIGIRLALWLVVSINVNAMFKLLFGGSRPYWYTTQVKAFSQESSFGFPSGHAQNSVVIFGGMGWLFKKRWALWAGAIIAFLIGLSRLYLAVHFPSDVFAGWLIGLVLLLLLLSMERPVLDWVHRHSLMTNTLAAFIVSLFLIAIVYIPTLFLSGWTTPQAWLDNVAITNPKSLIDPLNIFGAYSSAGSFFGLAFGALWITNNPLQTKGVPAWKLLIRYILGLIGVLVFWKGLDLLPIFAGDKNFFDMVMRFIRYALTGFWISGLGPYTFKKINI